jgi:5-(carboxyamino)imidazole ribonucleotide mutase
MAKQTQSAGKPLVGVIMGSKSDWETMQHADQTLTRFGVAHECRVLSAHRTPEVAGEYAATAEERGLKVIIAAAGGAAHLAGVVASSTIIPVLACPMQTPSLGGLDSLLAMVQMPGGIPVGTLAIGKAGATNAALLAIGILALEDESLRKKLHDFRKEQADKVLKETLP